MNRPKSTIFILLLLMLLCLDVYSQCYSDRHNTSLENSWLSCSTSSSPNPNRDRGHWILYEFDEEKRIAGLQLWNINHPDHLNSGAKSIALDYRDKDGEWKNHDFVTLSKADGSGFYEGEAFQMLEHVITDQVLLYIFDNHGGPCTGLAEVKFNLLSSTTSTEEISEDHFDIEIIPNPFFQIASVTITDLEEKEIQYEIISSTGQVIQRNKANTQNGKAQFELKAQNIPAGSYFLKIIDGLRASTRKLSIHNK